VPERDEPSEMSDKKGEDSTRDGRITWLMGPPVTIVVMTILNVLFWSCVDFRGFHPPSEGVWKERLFFMGVTESGPFAWFWLGTRDLWNDLFAGSLGVGIPLLVVLTHTVKRRRLFWTIVTTGAVLFWFLFGFSGAATRIT